MSVSNHPPQAGGSASPTLPILDFVLSNYRNFNARATRDALLAYWRHVEGGGKMFWAIAGAMSSAQLGITLAPAIRAGADPLLVISVSFFVMLTISASRSPDTTSCSVRTPNWLRKPSLIRCEINNSARVASPPVAV